MIISDLEYLEEVFQASEIVGSAGLNLNLDKLIDSLKNEIFREANKIVNKAKKQAKAKSNAVGRNVVAVASATSSKPGNVTAIASVSSS